MAESDTDQHMSEALKQLLAAEEREHDAQNRSDENANMQHSGDTGVNGNDSPSAATQQELREQSVGAEQLDLGELDITSSEISLDGLDAQLEKFAQHEVILAILEQARMHPSGPFSCNIASCSKQVALQCRAKPLSLR